MRAHPFANRLSLNRSADAVAARPAWVSASGRVKKNSSPSAIASGVTSGQIQPSRVC